MTKTAPEGAVFGPRYVDERALVIFQTAYDTARVQIRVTAICAISAPGDVNRLVDCAH
jgi:hypothetical protein